MTLNTILGTAVMGHFIQKALSSPSSESDTQLLGSEELASSRRLLSYVIFREMDPRQLEYNEQHMNLGVQTHFPK